MRFLSGVRCFEKILEMHVQPVSSALGAPASFHALGGDQANSADDDDDDDFLRQASDYLFFLLEFSRMKRKKKLAEPENK